MITAAISLWVSLILILAVVVLYYMIPQEIAWQDLPPNSNLVYDWEELTIKDTGIRVILPEDVQERRDALDYLKHYHNLEIHTKL